MGGARPPLDGPDWAAREKPRAPIGRAAEQWARLLTEPSGGRCAPLLPSLPRKENGEAACKTPARRREALRKEREREEGGGKEKRATPPVHAILLHGREGSVGWVVVFFFPSNRRMRTSEGIVGSRAPVDGAHRRAKVEHGKPSFGIASPPLPTRRKSGTALFIRYISFDGGGWCFYFPRAILRSAPSGMRVTRPNFFFFFSPSPALRKRTGGGGLERQREKDSRGPVGAQRALGRRGARERTWERLARVLEGTGN